MASNGIFDPATSMVGSYTYTVLGVAPCVDASASVNVSLSAAPFAGGNGWIALCATDAAVDLFSALEGSPDQGGYWTSPSGQPMGGSFDPGSSIPGIHVYTVPGQAPCPDASAQVTVTISDPVFAGASTSVMLCPEADPIDLFGLLAGAQPGGTWTLPSGASGGGTFTPGANAQGTYTYTLSGNAPCPDDQATVLVGLHPVGPVDAGADALSCVLDIAVEATGTWASGMWSGPAGVQFADAGQAATTVSSTNGGTFTLVWNTVSVDGCALSDAVQVTLTDPLSVVITTTDALCFGECTGTATAQVMGGTTGTGGFTYTWSAGAAQPGGAVNGLCAGTWSVTVSDGNGCTANAEFTIEEPDLLEITGISTMPITCHGWCDGTIEAVASGPGLFSLGAGTGWVSGGSFTGLCPGTYTVLVQNANGCTATMSTTVGGAAPVVAGFSWSPQPATVDDPSITFTNTSSPNAVQFTWDMAGLESSTSAATSFTFPGVLGNDYTVCLTAYDANGCADDYCAVVTILDVLQVHVPNAFTPDGDGINDLFGPVLNGQPVAEYEFLVYDRWGETIHRSLVPGPSWNGMVAGIEAPIGVYTWQLFYRAEGSTQRREARGHVTVVR
jgi:gliding motility-associated-like protein